MVFSTTLTVDLGAADLIVSVATNVDARTTYPWLAQIGLEVIQVVGGVAEGLDWDIQRGADDTDPVPHPSGSLLASDPLSPAYVGAGPPASTSGVGRQKFVDVGGNLVYDAGADVAVPVWTVLPGTVQVAGSAAPADVFVGVPEGDWYPQLVADPVDGFYVLLWIKGPGDDTDWTTDDVYPTGSGAPTSAADALGVGVADTGSQYLDRFGGAGLVWWVQTGTITAPVWAPQFGAIEAVTTGIPNPVTPGIIRLANLTFPSGDGIATPEGTYENIRALLVNTSTAAGVDWLGIPAPFGVRIGALFAHVLPPAAMAAGVRLTWDEVNYLFYADMPVADPITGVITYTELADADTILAGGIAQLLLIAYDV